MSVLILYYGILISYTENLSLEPTKGEKICLRSTTADGFFLTITLSLRCHMKPQRTWRTSQTRIETSFHFFNILKVQTQSTWGFTSQRGKVFKYHFTGVGMTSILTGNPNSWTSKWSLDICFRDIAFVHPTMTLLMGVQNTSGNISFQAENTESSAAHGYLMIQE